MCIILRTNNFVQRFQVSAARIAPLDNPFPTVTSSASPQLVSLTSDFCDCCGSRASSSVMKTQLPAVVKSACNAILPQFAHSKIAPDRVERNFRRRDNTEKSGSTGSMRTVTETRAQFLVIDLWIAVHIEVNKGNKVALFWWTSKLWRVVSLIHPSPGLPTKRVGAFVCARDCT